MTPRRGAGADCMPTVPFKSIIPLEFPRIEIVDVGAMLEDEGERYAPLVDQGLARITGFEPDVEQRARLIAARNSPHQYLPQFLGTGDSATFHITRYAGCSSLYRPDPKVIDLFTTFSTQPSEDGNFMVVRTETVQTRRLDDIPECPQPDLLKLDVQGAELDVLRGATRALQSTLVIEAEVEFIAIYENQPLFGDVQTFLRGLGFVLHKMIDISGRCLRPCAVAQHPYLPLSQAISADAIFVRQFFDLSKFSDDELLKSAAILHDVYHSIDLVLRLVTEIDKRKKSAFAAKYLQASSMNADPIFMNLKMHP